MGSLDRVDRPRCDQAGCGRCGHGGPGGAPRPTGGRRRDDERRPRPRHAALHQRRAWCASGQHARGGAAVGCRGPFQHQHRRLGPDSDVSGFGWGALADPNDLNQPARVDATQRLFSQRGSIVGDVVKLKGRMLFSYVPGDVGGPIVTEANLATGHIRFYASNSATTGFLEGTGVVMRI